MGVGVAAVVGVGVAAVCNEGIWLNQNWLLEAIGTVNVSTLSVARGRAGEDVMNDHAPSHAVTDKESARSVQEGARKSSVPIGTVGRY